MLFFSTAQFQAYYFTGLLLLLTIHWILRLSDPALKAILLGALILRLIPALIQVYTPFDMPYAGEDSFFFEYIGFLFAQGWQSSDFSPDQIGAAGHYYVFPAMIGAVYYIFGRYPVIIHSGVVILGVLIVYLTYRLAYLLSGKQGVARAAAQVAAFFPTLVFLSAVILRENILIILVLLTALLFTKWLKNGHYLYPAAVLISTGVMALFHGAMALSNWIYFIYFGLFNLEKKQFRITIRSVLISTVLIVPAVGFIITQLSARYQLDFFQGIFSISIIQMLVSRPPGRTGYLIGLMPQSGFDLLWHTPVRVFYFMFAPFPWMIDTLSGLLGFFETILYMFLCYYSVVGVRRLLKAGVKKAEAIGLAIVTLSIIVIFAWGTNNYGTAMRHRAKIAPLLIAMAITGLAGSKPRGRLHEYLGDERAAAEKSSEPVARRDERYLFDDY